MHRLLDQCFGEGPVCLVKVKADNYEARVSLTRATSSAVLQQLRDAGPSCCTPCRQRSRELRLDCDADVAREIVAVLREGERYSPPRDKVHLMGLLIEQLDQLGVPVPQSCRSAKRHQDVVLVPSYLFDPGDYPEALGVGGLLVYSSSTGGWANLRYDRDPRPPCLAANTPPDEAVAGSKWAASVLRAEEIGADHDLVYLVPNDQPAIYIETGVVLHSTTSSSRFPNPPEHHSFVFRNSAMAAARGKVHLLGGEPLHGPSYAPFEIYDPHLDCWFKAATPSGYKQQYLAHHTLVSDQQESCLLSFGGKSAQDSRHSGQVLLYDISSSKWSGPPRNCEWPGAATAACVAAVAVDAHTIVVLSADTECTMTRTDLLDLRNWQWRLGQPLQQAAYSPGVVLYERQVMVLGGTKGTDRSVASVHAYDPRTDSWSEKPPFPCGIWNASPVVARVASTLQHQR